MITNHVPTTPVKAEEKNEHSSRRRISFKILLFVLLFLLIFIANNYFVQPVWTEWNNYYTTRGFYEEPENTIEVAFLGSSITVSSISPTQMYEEYGICAYNFGTVAQPMMASYYWAQEVYRLHSESLTTVVLDVSMLRMESDDGYYHYAFDGMKLSSVKVQAAFDYAQNDLTEALNFLIPLFSYHERWSGLEQADFEKIAYEPVNGLRGYCFNIANDITEEPWNEISVTTGYLDQSALPIQLDEDSVSYLDLLIRFCEENGIQLILVKFPQDYWSSSYHNAVQQLADEYGLAFLDFNFSPLLDEIEYNFAADNTDGYHSNYFGAERITAYLGQWLTDNADVTDVRNDPQYSFMEDELEEYRKRVTEKVILYNDYDPADYIADAITVESNEIFLMVNDSASNEMTDELKEQFREFGLFTLSDLSYQSAYLGVIQDGTVQYESTDSYQSETYQEATASSNQTESDMTEQLPEPYTGLTYSGTTKDGKSVYLESGGATTGSLASCVIENVEYAINSRGLNIVVYNSEQGCVVDSAVFDLHQSSKRESGDLDAALKEAEATGTTFEDYSDTLKEYDLYLRRQELTDLAVLTNNTYGYDGLLGYLETYMDINDIAILISVRGDAAASLTEEARDVLAEMGLAELAEIEYQNSYVGLILAGNVIYEDRSDIDAVTYTSLNCSMTSSGLGTGDSSSIIIDGTEYSPNQQGINVVIYDTKCEMVFNTRNFDTSTTAASIPDQEE